MALIKARLLKPNGRKEPNGIVCKQARNQEKEQGVGEGLRRFEGGE